MSSGVLHLVVKCLSHWTQSSYKWVCSPNTCTRLGWLHWKQNMQCSLLFRAGSGNFEKGWF